ncbi:hypothetical protein B0H14DRAFT_3769517 [Mycena olivaceomarginata]|nr:hypothetical protein B0H14DRAFT_3769517 [Mycena olivaceomarginata]
MIAFLISALVVLVSLAVPAASLANTSTYRIPAFLSVPLPQSSFWQELTSHFYIPLILLASALGRFIVPGEVLSMIESESVSQHCIPRLNEEHVEMVRTNGPSNVAIVGGMMGSRRWKTGRDQPIMATHPAKCRAQRQEGWRLRKINLQEASNASRRRLISDAKFVNAEYDGPEAGRLKGSSTSAFQLKMPQRPYSLTLPLAHKTIASVRDLEPMLGIIQPCENQTLLRIRAMRKQTQPCENRVAHTTPVRMLLPPILYDSHSASDHGDLHAIGRLKFGPHDSVGDVGRGFPGCHRACVRADCRTRALFANSDCESVDAVALRAPGW